MVIPLGSGGGTGMVPLMGPPPPELMPRFRKIKICLVVLIGSLLVKFVAGMFINWKSMVWIVYSCLNPILNAVIGIFLLKDDPLFAGVHQCLVRVFCSSCADQCQGGMNCLCTWFFCNMITCIFALLPLPDSDSDIMIITDGFNKLSKPSLWPSQVWAVEFSFFLVATILALLVQIIGAYEGWQAYRQATAMAAGSDNFTGGGYGDPYGGYPEARQQRMTDPEAGTSGGRPTGGGGQSAANFQPFQGSGQRLGS